MAEQRRVLLEVIACSVDDAVAAASGGADRIELCSALELGGLTPSFGLIAGVKPAVRLPVMFMLRPRPAGFAYGEAELSVMERDAESALGNGADGLVFGALTHQGRVDKEGCQRLLRIAEQRPGCQTVFHRAFDVVADPRAALEQLIDLGFTRVLTSGRRKTAVDGADEIRRTIERAAGRIEVLPGGGVQPEDAPSIMRVTRATQLHASLAKIAVDSSTASNPSLAFGVSPSDGEPSYRITDQGAVRALRRALDGLSLP